jgi:hypothetical protein
MDVATPADRNVTQKEAENRIKYNSLCIEIQRIWNMKCMLMPVKMGATGIVTKCLKKNFEAISGKQLYLEHNT